MRHDLATKWGERWLILQTQLEREPAHARAWRWQGEAKVLRFLLHRYGEVEAPADLSAPELSALERSLLRLALTIADVNPKHPRPSARERAAILARIQFVGEQARESDKADDSWLSGIGLWLQQENEKARRNIERQIEREAAWKRRQRELFWEKREKWRR